MKKVVSTILLTALILAAVAITASAAAIGTGLEAVASEINMVKTGITGQRLCFTDTDFKTALGTASFSAITVTATPSADDGTLLLSGAPVSAGQKITRRNLSMLSFVPKSADIKESSFSFKSDNAATGAEIKCVIKFIDKVNYAPKIDGETSAAASFSTQRDISVFGRLSATDPEGDKLEYIVISYPTSGTLSLDGESGSFSYKPNTGKLGLDSFVFVVMDEYGNYSEAKEVILSVNERMSEVVYTDLVGTKYEGAAVAMTAMGIMGGTRIGDGVYFMPEGEVTRAEFVAMAMKAVGMRADESLTETFFDDNADIPEPLVKYVATAQKKGIVNGSFETTGLYFRPNDTVTKYEAAIIMASLAELTDLSVTTSASDIYDAPVFARGQISAMCSLGIFEIEDGAIGVRDKLSRAEVAGMLYALAKIV